VQHDNAGFPAPAFRKVQHAGEVHPIVLELDASFFQDATSDLILINARPVVQQLVDSARQIRETRGANLFFGGQPE
jgi:hypothetical protein